MWALAELGLDGTADSRAVKRAYARLLKITRPDSDPEGFQRLHAAYQAALAVVQDNALPASEEASGTGDTRPHTRAQPLQQAHDATTSPAQREAVAQEDPANAAAAAEIETFDADAFLEGCIELLVRGAPDDVRRWLEAQPALWSLQLKSQLGYWLLNKLHEHSPPVAEENLDVLLDFFDLNHVLSGVDPDAVMHLRTRLGFRRDLQPGRERALGERVFTGSVPDRHKPALSMMRQLRRPFRWWQALAFSLRSRRPREMRYFVLALDDGDFDSLAGLIDLRQARFWLAAGDLDRQSMARRMVALARCLVVAFSLASILGLLYWLTNDLPSRQTLGPAAWFGTQVFVYVLPTLYAAWEIWVAVARYFNWQSAPEDMPTRRPLLRLFWVPVLSGLSVLLALLPPPLDALAMSAGSVAALTGLVRWFRRSGLRLDFSGWRLLLLIPFLKGLAGGLAVLVLASGKSLGIGMGALGLLLWSIDAWLRRKSWWPMVRMQLPWKASPDASA